MASNEQNNKQPRNRLTDTEKRVTAVRRVGGGGWVKRAKGLSNKQNKSKNKKTNTMVITRGKGRGVGEGQGEINSEMET